MSKVEADFQPFLSPPWPPATSLQDGTGELCCPAKTSHEELMGRMFSCCFADRLLGAASSSKKQSKVCDQKQEDEQTEFLGWEAKLI